MKWKNEVAGTYILRYFRWRYKPPEQQLKLGGVKSIEEDDYLVQTFTVYSLFVFLMFRPLFHLK